MFRVKGLFKSELKIWWRIVVFVVYEVDIGGNKLYSVVILVLVVVLVMELYNVEWYLFILGIFGVEGLMIIIFFKVVELLKLFWELEWYLFFKLMCFGERELLIGLFDEELIEFLYCFVSFEVDLGILLVIVLIIILVVGL